MATTPDPEAAKQRLEEAQVRARADEALQQEAVSLLGQVAAMRSDDSWRDRVRAVFRGD